MSESTTRSKIRSQIKPMPKAKTYPTSWAGPQTFRLEELISYGWNNTWDELTITGVINPTAWPNRSHPCWMASALMLFCEIGYEPNSVVS